MATRMQQRRGTAQQWTDADPILAAGEIGFETDTNQFKIGDGVNAWSDLSFFKNLEDLGGSLDDYVLVSSKGQINGVAQLDGTGKIPSSQIPDLVGLDSEISSAVSTAVANLVDGAPAALNTLNEIATILGDSSNITGNIISQLGQLDESVGEIGPTVVGHTSTLTTLGSTVSGHTTTLSEQGEQISTLETNVENHALDTTNVHGILDTAALATITYANGVAESTADSKISTHNSDTTDVHGIANTANLATTSGVSTAVSDHNSDTTDVHGIADTAALATKSYADTAEADAITAAGTAADSKIATAVAALTKSSVGLANVDNTADASKPVSTAQATAIATAKSEAIADATSQVNALLTGAPAALNTLDELAAALGDDANFASTVTTSLGLKAPLASPTFTGTVTVAAEGVAFTDGTQTKEGVVSRTPIVQKTASYTLSALTERDNLVEVASGSATTITIPADSAVNYPVGTSLDILQTSTGQVTIAGAAGVTVNATPGLKLRTQWSSATLFKRAANTWVVYGDLMA